MVAWGRICLFNVYDRTDEIMIVLTVIVSRVFQFNVPPTKKKLIPDILMK